MNMRLKIVFILLKCLDASPTADQKWLGIRKKSFGSRSKLFVMISIVEPIPDEDEEDKIDVTEELGYYFKINAYV